MVLTTDLAVLITDVHLYLSTHLSSIHLPTALEAQRVQLLSQLESVAQLNGIQLKPASTQQFSKTSSTGAAADAKSLIAGKDLLQSSTSLSSHSSGTGSYSSASYTTNSYGSHESNNNATVTQDDIYEEFDVQQMRRAAAPPAPITATSSSSTSQPNIFFSSLRSSLSYNKKHKFTLRSNKTSDTTAPTPKTSNLKKKSSTGSCGSIRLATEDSTDSVNGSSSSPATEGAAEEDCALLDEENNAPDNEEDDTYGYSVTPVPCSTLVVCCEHHGALQKKKHKTIIKPWRSFHCVLSNGVLYLYGKDTDQRQRKSLVLAGYDARVATAEEATQGKLGYLELVAPGKRTHTFMALSTPDRDAWLVALSRHTKNRKLSIESPLQRVLPPSPPIASFTSIATVPAQTSTGPPASSPHPPAGEKQEEESTEGAQGEESDGEELQDEDTFTSDEEYESVNIDPLRVGSGPSLSEMLEPHIFPSTSAPCDATNAIYYSVPDEDSSVVTVSSTSTTDTMDSPTTSKKKPARPPPPVINNNKLATPSKNTSALHNSPVLKQAVNHTPLSEGNSNKAGSNKSSTSSADSSKINSSALHRVLANHFSSQSKSGISLTDVAKRRLFGVSNRPLPAAPAVRITTVTAETGELYSVIEDEDHYEVSELDDIYEMNESDGSQLIPPDYPDSGSSTPRKISLPMLSEPPPLPLRGPPPIPKFHALPPKPVLNVTPPQPEDSQDELEDYDIPENLGIVVHQAVNDALLNFPLESEEIAPLPQDLSVVMPTYPQPDDRSVHPAVPVKAGNFLSNFDEDDNFYKVPVTRIIDEDIYKVPPSDPIPVGNNNDTFNNNNFLPKRESIENTQDQPGTMRLTSNSNGSCGATDELYQVPSSEIIPVNPLNVLSHPSKVTKDSISHSPESVNTKKEFVASSSLSKSKDSVSTVQSKLYCTPKCVNAGIFPGNKGSSPVNVKERVAMINKKKEINIVTSPIKSSNDVVVTLGNKEVRLDQDKKRAFLESTLDFNKAKVK